MEAPTGGVAGPQPGMLKTGRPQLLYVMHDFEARSPDELSLRKGDVVELIADDEEFGDGWYTVCGVSLNCW